MLELDFKLRGKSWLCGLEAIGKKNKRNMQRARAFLCVDQEVLAVTEWPW